MATDAAHVTRTEPGGDVAAVLRRRGRSSWVKRKGPRQLVPIWSSWPCLGRELVGSHLAIVEQRDISEQNTYLLRLAPLRREHHARIVRQHVQPLLPGGELVGAFLDRGQVRQVQLQELDAPSGAPLGMRVLDGLDGLVGLVGAAACNVDGRVGGVQDLDQLEADARVAACHDVDLRTTHSMSILLLLLNPYRARMAGDPSDWEMECDGF